MTRGPRRITLVLGGGGLKGFAHIGVLKALRERGIRPSAYAGTSIGALIAAATVGGMSPEEMERRAASLQRRDLFRVNSMGIVLERMKSPSIYLEEPLRALCESVTPNRRFDELPTRLLVNTVDVQRGTQMVWGLAGLTGVYVPDAVYASCALPGYFPPGKVDGRLCIDGGTMDNLPVAVASTDTDAIIAVDVGSSDLTEVTDIESHGFANIYMRAASVMMHSLQRLHLARWEGPPMILIRPRVNHLGWFSFGQTRTLIEEGYRSAHAALEHADGWFASPGGVFPRRTVRVAVDRGRCTGCGLCAAMAPHVMGLDAQGKAFARTRHAEWSPADGDFVHHCPTGAIEAMAVDSGRPPVGAEPAPGPIAPEGDDAAA